MDEISTARLRWRPVCADDVDGYLRFVDDYDVVKWTSSWPHPVSRDFVANRCQPVDPARGFAGPVFLGDEQIGGIGILDGELGYFFARKHWGCGYASEIAHAIVARAFQRSNLTEITATIMVENTGSARVLEKTAFRKSGTCRCSSRAQGRTFDAHRYKLTRADWLAQNPLCIETSRLVIKSIAPKDIGAFQAFAGRTEVANMMQSLPHPLSCQQARDWVENRAFGGHLGFCPGVYLKNGPLIGVLGLGGDPVSVAYFFDPAHWGQGYATEAMRAFIADMCTRFGLKDITAGAMHDNRASQQVLAKLGFVKTGEKMHQPALRLEPACLFLYRLSLKTQKAAQ